jgi:hypothetical protein
MQQQWQLTLGMKCEDRRFWRDRWLQRKFTGLHPETGIKTK